MLFAPPATPGAVVSRIHSEVLRTLQHAELVTFMQNEGAAPVGSVPADAGSFFRHEIENYGRIVKASGAKAGL
jgi:tripartite-type tricarboxylate transporter receptor subunit TctC